MVGHGAADGAPSQRSKGGLLKEKLELERVKTKDGRTRVTLRPIEDQLTFDKGFYVFIRALQLLRAHNQGVVLVGLGGASGSGKTAFSAKVKDFMPGIAVISMDNYNDGSKVVDSNFDDPRLTDYDLLLANLSDLQQGKPADIPIYDFKSSQRVGYSTQEVPEARVVIIEGIYALSERLKHLLDLRVSITGGVHFDLVKRVLRDISRSGQGPEEIIQQITDTVYPMYKAFIEPDLKAAQLKIHNSFNPFTGFMNATYILKAQREPELTQAEAVASLGEGALIKTEAEICDIHLLPPNEDPETCASWLRMRNRDGRYTLMFEEWVNEGDFIISPRIQFEVSVRVLGGLMALGYEIGTVMRRTSTLMTSASGDLTVKFDDVEHLGKFVQVQGKDRDKVAAAAKALQLSDFIPRSYIEQVQLSKLTTDFQALTDDMRKRFSVDGRSVLDEIYGSSPPLSSFFSPVRVGIHPGAGRPGSRSTGGHVARGLGGRFAAAARLGGSSGSSTTAAGGGNRGPLVAPFSPGAFGSSPPSNDSLLLSTSAPVRGSSPIAINHHLRSSKAATAAAAAAGAASGSNGGPAAAGSGSNGAGVAAGGGSSSLGAPPAAGGAVESPSSSVAAAAGSTLGPSSLISSDGNGSIPGSVESGSGSAVAAMAAARQAAAASGGSGQQQQQQSRGVVGGVVGTQPPAAVAAAAGGGYGSSGGANGGAGGSSGGGFAVAKGNGLLGQQLRNSNRTGSSSSLQGMDAGGSGAGAGGGGEHSRLSVTGGDASAASLALLRRLQEQMEVVAEGFRRHSGMQLHLDALTHQYKHLNEALAALTGVTKGLEECVQQMRQQQQVSPALLPAGQQQQQQGAGRGSSSSATSGSLLGLGLSPAAAAALLAASAAFGGVAAGAALLVARKQ